MLHLKSISAVLAATFLSAALQAAPLGSAFTYQGKLALSGIDVTDNCDFEFGLWDAAAGGVEIAVAIDVLNVPVSDGVFTVELDFGAGVFDGDARWLEIAVVCPAGGGLTTLAPRQELTPTPNALFASGAGAMEWSGLLNVPADIADGDDVEDDDADPTNELQDLSLGGNTLSLSGDASPVDLSGYLDNTDDQTLAEVLDQGNNAGGASISNIGTTTTSALTVSGLNCTANANGGALTADASGVVSCSDDDAGAGGGNTLDQAYDQGGAGAGRTITADSGAVKIDGTDGLTLDSGSLLQLAGDPVQVGSLAIGQNPLGVFVSGRYAYVVDGGSADLKVIDVSDSTTPSLVGSLAIGTFPSSVYVSGRYAYVVDQDVSDLKVIDVSNPGAPTLAGSLILGIGSVPNWVYVSGRYAYVVDLDSDDLKVIDVSNPTTPSLAGSLAIGTSPTSVFVSGRYAYVVDPGSDDLKVIDVSVPGSPTLAGSLGIGTNPSSVYVSGRHAYVTDPQTADLKVIDVSDPITLSVVGSLGIGATPTDVYVSGRYAYVIDASSNDLKVIDVSDPGAPSLAGSLGIGDFPISLSVSGRHAYVVDFSADDLKVIDVSGAEVTALMAHSLEAGNLQVRNDVMAQGQLQVTGGVNIGSGGLFSDGDVGVAGGSVLQSAGDPVLVGSLAIGTIPLSVYVSGRYAYVVDIGSADLKVIDVSDPGAPSLAGSLSIGIEPKWVFVSGRYAYVVDGGSDDLKVIDVSDPGMPMLAGSLGLGQNPVAVFVSGRYAFVVDENSDDLKVIDVSDPAAPTLVGSLALGPFPSSVYVSGRYAYIVDQDAGEFQVIDVSDPGTPTLAGSLAMGGNPISVYISGRYAYVVDYGSDELKVIDVSDATTPSLAGSLAIGALPSSVFVSGRYAYVVDSTSSDLKVIDVSDPGTPTLAGSLGIGAAPSFVHVSGRYAYVVDQVSDDLKVIEVSGAELPSLTAHSLEAGNLQIRNDVIAQGQLQVTGGVNVGTGGIFSDGNVGVSGTLALANDIAPVTSPANLVQLYAEDEVGTSELKVRDEAGNITVLSPHNFSLIGQPSEPMAWSFYSENDHGKINVDMLRALRLIERMSGEKLVYTELEASGNSEEFERMESAILAPTESLIESVNELMRQNQELRSENKALARRIVALEKAME